MLRSVEFSSLTTGEPSGAMGEVVPLEDNNTGHMPTGSVSRLTACPIHDGQGFVRQRFSLSAVS